MEPTQAGERATHRGVAAVGILHGALLLLSLPVIILVAGFSLFEGGDLPLKHRVQVWALVAVWGNLAAAVLLAVTSARFYRGQPVNSVLVTSISAVLVGLALGWVWVYQSGLASDPMSLGALLVLTTPAPIAFGSRVWRRPTTSSSPGG